MKQRSLVITLTAWLPMACSIAGAQQLPAVIASDSPAAPEEDTGKTIVIHVEPARPPYAALRHRLTPSMLDQTPGNAAILYGRACLLAAQDTEWEKRSEDVYRWLEQPLGELPLEEVRAALARYGTVLHELALAARRETCQWDLPVRSEHVALLLPELSRLRQLARILAVRTRLAIAEERHDDAVDDLRTGFAMARHLGEAPLLIHSLVGMAIASMTTDCLQELEQAPGAPNLYWAVTFLPRPVVSIRPAVETEMNLVFLIAPQLQTVDTMQRTPEQWSSFSDDLAEAMRGIMGAGGDGGMTSDQARWATTLMSLKLYPQAKRFLVDLGYPADEVEAMPVPQVMALHTVHTLERVRDDVFKWFGVPFPQAYGRMVANAEAGIASPDAQTVIPFLLQALIPAVSRVYLQQTDLERRLAVIRCVEALRFHAAERGGGFPDDLDEIEAVPIPEDPVTGAPFVYRKDGAEASLFCPAPVGEPKRRYERTYVITLRNN